MRWSKTDTWASTKCEIRGLRGVRRRTRAMPRGRSGPSPSNPTSTSSARAPPDPAGHDRDREAGHADQPRRSGSRARGPSGPCSLVDTGKGGSSCAHHRARSRRLQRDRAVPANWSLTGATCSTPAGTVAGATATTPTACGPRRSAPSATTGTTRRRRRRGRRPGLSPRRQDGSAVAWWAKGGVRADRDQRGVGRRAGRDHGRRAAGRPTWRAPIHGGAGPGWPAGTPSGTWGRWPRERSAPSRNVRVRPGARGSSATWSWRAP